MKCKCGNQLVFDKNTHVGKMNICTVYRYHCMACGFDTGKCLSKEEADKVVKRGK